MCLKIRTAWYTKHNYNKNDRIFLAIDNNNKITYTGTKINHSNNPNRVINYK